MPELPSVSQVWAAGVSESSDFHNSYTTDPTPKAQGFCPTPQKALKRAASPQTPWSRATASVSSSHPSSLQDGLRRPCGKKQEGPLKCPCGREKVTKGQLLFGAWLKNPPQPRGQALTGRGLELKAFCCLPEVERHCSTSDSKT